MEQFNDYYKIYMNMKNENLSLLKLEIIDNLLNYEDFKNLLAGEKMKIINLIYNNYLHNDYVENNLFNIIDVSMTFIDFIKENNFNPKYFDNIIEYNI